MRFTIGTGFHYFDLMGFDDLEGDKFYLGMVDEDQTFNTSQAFDTEEDARRWAITESYEAVEFMDLAPLTGIDPLIELLEARSKK